MNTFSETQPHSPPSDKAVPAAHENTTGNTEHKAFLLYLRRVFVYLLSFYVLLHLLWAYETPHGFVLRIFIFGLPGMFLALLPVFLPTRISRFYLLLSYIFLTVPSFVCAAHLGLFQTPVTAQSFFALFETGPSESMGLSPAHFSWRLCLPATTIIIIPAWLLQRALKSPRPASGKIQIGLLAGFGGIFLALCLAVGPVKLLRANIIYNVYISFAEFCDHMARLRADLHKIADIHFTNVRLTMPPEEERSIVVVIGESANRAHHSLYGYGRNTNPNLTAISGELLVFKDIISTCAEPADCLSQILSLPANGEKRLSLLTLFNQAGFNTYWLSNQPDIQDTNTATTILTAPAYGNVQLNRGGAARFSPGPDGALLAPLEKILRNDPDRKVIFIRLMGSKPEYALRYPPEFARFTQCSDIQAAPEFTNENCVQLNNYDNSIVYTDAVLKDIIELTDRLAPESALVYFSVHGANAYGEPYANAPQSKRKSIHFYEIPFFVWLSEGFRAANASSAASWLQYTARRASLNDLPYTLADLAGVTFKSYDAARSLLSEQFQTKPRLVQGWDYDIDFPIIQLDKNAAPDGYNLHAAP